MGNGAGGRWKNQKETQDPATLRTADSLCCNVAGHKGVKDISSLPSTLPAKRRKSLLDKKLRWKRGWRDSRVTYSPRSTISENEIKSEFSDYFSFGLGFDTYGGQR